ncbi:hypothetical protein LTR72_009487 [Exophiala xenobiotica]|nr:hypothetical protein LTR72_009487 [Exophiala xenobiotica]KAK5291898.1 hypothetical protein LTR14_005447 [Exophiala xenobiotica]KAK5314252.1 hypothetical protein LTR93_010531 [Exophiala xenobiotica]KAK5401918.1 hypothetical protein LTR06_010836 [Exophiala xenobiotica]KAK5494689.1 hypothetical protein LTR55_003076 [Exophiala xenobiotica]
MPGHKQTHLHVEENAEKGHSTAQAQDPTEAEREIYHQDGAILVDLGAAHKGGQASALKTASDGHTVLNPQPSDDPLDPLNWSWWKKHSILLTISVAAFIADFQAGAAAPCIIAQGVEWKLSPDHVNYANNLNVLLVGIGGVVAIPFLYIWGRAPLMFWVVLSGAMFSLGCTLSQSFNVYYGMKAMQGFTLTIGQTSGLAFIHDMFFFHEQARKIGIWTAVFLASPYFGPLFANFILAGTGSWRAVYWLIFAICIFNLILIGLFLDETWYRRDIPTAGQPARGNRLLRIVGIWQIRNHKNYFSTVKNSVTRLIVVFLKPVILLLLIY